MAVFVNSAFEGHWPVGVAAVVIANTAIEAAELLNDELQKRGLRRSATREQFVKLADDKHQAVVLCDGDY